MSGLPYTHPADLLARIVETAKDTGTAVTALPSPNVHPRKLLLEDENVRTEVWAYVRPIYQSYRRYGSQYSPEMRLDFPRAEMNPSGPTVIIGYNREMDVFAGVDARHHLRSRGKNKYIDIDALMLRCAQEDGFALSRTDDDVFFAFRSYQFAFYAVNADFLHQSAEDNLVYDLLKRASTMTRMPNNEIEKIAQPRREEIREKIRTKLRNRFRYEVREAYEHKCAVTGLGAGLHDAHHIYPAEEPDTSYAVTNGILLEPTLHRAFHSSLIYLQYFEKDWEDDKPKYRILVNYRKKARLPKVFAEVDKDRILSLDEKSIYVPADPQKRPDVEMVQEAIVAREIFGDRPAAKKKSQKMTAPGT